MASSTDNQGASLETLIEQYKCLKNSDTHMNRALKILAHDGQKPQVMVIACCDSRIDPAILLGCEPGDIFVVRNVANLVPPFNCDERHHGTSAALEFAVHNLGVKDIVVLGHSQCGGIRALMETNTNKTNTCNFIDTWMSIAEGAKKHIQAHAADASLEIQAHQCEQASIAISLDNLASFPWIKNRLDNQSMRLHGWHYTIASNTLTSYDTAAKTFNEL